MLTRIALDNFGPLSSLQWKGLGRINLILGPNSSGKTFLLKALYSALRTIEANQRGNDPRTVAEILAEKLHWTFQAEKIGDLVTKGSEAALRFALTLDDREFSYSFGKDTAKSISTLTREFPPRAINSVFLPPKEVLSLQNIILKSRGLDRIFGFDDCYYDLAMALSYPGPQEQGGDEFAQSRGQLESLFGGRIEFDPKSQRWLFKNAKNQKFQMSVTAEGIKKIAILDTLLSNRYLTPNSVVCIDEPESALHPEAISTFLDIIQTLAVQGIQFFIASHSYFVVKKLCLIALENQQSLPVLSFRDGLWEQDDLKDGMPPNPIIDESIRLYEAELSRVLG